MATPGIIRKNIDSGEWEHFVTTNHNLVSSIPFDIKTINANTTKGKHQVVINNSLILDGYWVPFKGDVYLNSITNEGPLQGDNYEDYKNNNLINYVDENGILQKRNDDIRFLSEKEIQILEDITKQTLDLKNDKTLYDNNEYNNIIDTTIIELLPPINDLGLPKFVKQPTDGLQDSITSNNESGLYFKKTGVISLIKDSNYTIYVLEGYSIDLETIIKDPVTESDINLKSEWYRDDELKNQSYNKSNITISLQTPTDRDEGVWLCNAYNKIGKKSSNKFQLSIEKLNEPVIFGQNLVKNGDFSSGLTNWDVIEGTPRITYEDDTITSTEEYKLTEDMFIPGQPTDSIDLSYIKGPEFSTILDFETDLNKQKHQIFHYLTGGILDKDDNIICRLKQTIDLSEYSQWIDGHINGVRAVYGNLFAWLGSGGTHPALTLPYVSSNKLGIYDIPSKEPEKWTIDSSFETWRPYFVSGEMQGTYTTYFPHDITIGDRVSIVLKLYNESNNIIESNYRLINPTHQYNDIRMFLRQQNIYIPHGTRTIDVEIVFEKQNEYKIFNFKKNADRSKLTGEYTDWYKNWENIVNENKKSNRPTHMNDLCDYIIGDVDTPIIDVPTNLLDYAKKIISKDIESITTMITKYLKTNVATPLNSIP